MTTSTPDAATAITIAAIAAVQGGLPQVGEECVVSVDGRRSPALVAGVSLQGASTEAQAHWSELALIDLAVPREASSECLFDGKVRQFELLDKPGQAPVAAGLALGRKPSGVSSASGGLTIWLTGLSGAGKSTLAQEMERRLQGHRKIECLDADVVRTHLCKGLGYSAEDRMENVRRLALTARLIAETGAMVLVSAISPYRAARDEARSLAGGFLEVYVNAPLGVCESRDVKGLYKRARNGEIKSFTGIDDPYEPPLAPDIECRTDLETLEESVGKILAAIERAGESSGSGVGITPRGGRVICK
jgi:adenylylsulfate kinase